METSITKTNPKIIIDNNICIRCCDCIKICPQQAISISFSPSCSKCVKYCINSPVPCNMSEIIIDEVKCDLCKECIKICNKNALNENI